MKKFFEEHSGVAIILIVIAILLLIVGSVKGLDEGTGKVNGSGVASIVGNAYSSAIDKFKDSFDNVLSGTSDGDNSNPTSGPNGEPLVSKTESQIGKYADIDGDGTIDGIIFADLIIGGSGKYGPSGMGTYTIPTISSSKSYYISQESYTNKLGGTAEVLTPIGTGEDRFYIMSLNNLSGTYDWYNAAKGNMNDYTTTTSQEFGKGKDNTTTMISKWDSKAYGEQNTCADHKDIWGQIKTQANNGWFVPSRQEWAAFAGQLGIAKSNYSSKGLSGWYWSSSQYNPNVAYNIDLYNGYVSNDHVNGINYVRLATTF
ncbi:hypothetical protein C7U55_05220 [Faecalibacillus faecis]|uniref:Uncharacterized protein n=1 Tax=Faecalibacillus faecis TaxID=1982628 RepID=A0A2T3G0F2_9FIRM|nr:hypothetical protein C7U55_05220 [Faecalibacillus faecis]